MKKINKAYIVIASIILMFSLKSNAQIVKAEIRATGLTCSMCSNAINKQLKSMPEVAKVENAGFFIGSLIITAKSETIANGSYILMDSNSNKSGDIKFQVLDKGYVTEKEFKKLSKSNKDVATYSANNEEDFHIKIVK